MRINKYLAQATDLSRRAADGAVQAGRVLVNSAVANQGQDINPSDLVSLDGQLVTPAPPITILLNKPAGYVCSRDGQGSKTIYDLLPSELHHLKSVGRLDKDSSGLLLLTNDGTLAQELTHPKFAKHKVYEIVLDKPLALKDKQLLEQGVLLADGPSKFSLGGKFTNWTVTMQEGRNRQIRRTFAALGYKVTKLRRSQIGTNKLNGLKIGAWRKLKEKSSKSEIKK